MGKNLLVKQPHPFKTCIMYYLQLESYNTLAMQVLLRQWWQSSSKSLYQKYTLFNLQLATLKNAYIMRLSFLGQIPKKNRIRLLPFSKKIGNLNFFLGRCPKPQNCRSMYSTQWSVATCLHPSLKLLEIALMHHMNPS